MNPKVREAIEQEAALHATQYDQELGLPESWGPVEDFKLGAEFGFNLAIEKVSVLREVMPEVLERLKTYSYNSHLGSPSEKVYYKLVEALEQFDKLTKDETTGL